MLWLLEREPLYIVFLGKGLFWPITIRNLCDLQKIGERNLEMSFL